ncbi:MAG: helix-turn-helix transcriptional regulator [Eubacteriales bacterium]|nr:helix-turn-helix transcriptional regulator [Eubacteriales bacterium]
MMTGAYSESYLNDAMENLGDMVDYSVCDLGFDPDEFFGWFISSKISSEFESGNPKYIAGMSGVELANAILKEVNVTYKYRDHEYTDYKGKEYWSGWIYAYYQWITGKRFCDLVERGLKLSTVMSMYILHEADESKFVEVANEIVSRNVNQRKPRLVEIRKARGYSQKELSDASGVSLRMIQLYEQRQNDINKAQASVVLKLSKALGCGVEDILE